MTNETLFLAIGDINESYIQEAKESQKTASRSWLRWGSIAAALCLLIGAALLSNLLDSGSGPFGSGDATVFAAHREDFTPEIDSEILAQFDDPTEVKKAYVMRANEWFLSDELTDFSQAVTTYAVYVAPGGEEPTDTDAAFSIYDVDEQGRLQWDCTAYPPEDASVPFGFSGLTYEVLHHALKDIDYKDYIITYAPTLGIVFVWVRGTAGDTLLTYPTRPDLLDLEVGGAYTLAEVQAALSSAYHSCGDEIRIGHSDRITDRHTAHTDSHNTEDGYHADSHHTDNHHTQHSTAASSFVPGMGCNDRSCTNRSHFHDCDKSCRDPAHYHSCSLDCGIEAHGHPKDHHEGHH